jgi:hypothetical protein
LYDNSISMATATIANHGMVLDNKIPAIVTSFGVV